MITFVHRSHAMRRVLAQLDALPRARKAVVVAGARGTGKKRLAQRLHRAWGGRGQLLVVDCTLPHAHRARLFGHESRLDAGQGGTLVLANIEALERDVLRAVSRASPTLRLGDPRGWGLVATTDDLAALQASGRVDRALRELLRGTVVELPPLRERRADLPQLVRELVRTLCDDAKEERRSISADALDALAAYPWPENVTELISVLEHAMVATARRARIELADLPRRIRGTAEVVVGTPTEWPSLAEVEKQWILRTLQRCGGSRSVAAEALGIHPNTLGRKLKAYGLGRTRATKRTRGRSPR